MSRTIKAPENDRAAWLFTHWDEVEKAIRLLNGLSNMRVQLVPVSAGDTDAFGKWGIKGDGDDLLLTLPIQSKLPLTTPTADVTSLRASVMEIQALLRQVGVKIG